MKLLVTGGTVFVSRYVAEYFVHNGDEVYVLNRNSRSQSEGVHLINGDRHNLGESLKNYAFDAVLDITAYTKQDVQDLKNALGDVPQYIFISSSAVYPETEKQPFVENQTIGYNSVWKDYGLNKCAAEAYIAENIPNAYILRPPYFYGPMQNLYREGFVFDCAMKKRPFYIPKDGSMPLQFFHVEDLCRLIKIILEEKPNEHILNVGNPQTVDINEWVELCYKVVGTPLKKVYVDESHEQRSYFCFYDYGYVLNVEKQMQLLSSVKPLEEGLKESFEWYIRYGQNMFKKPYMQYIDENLR